MYKRQEDNDTDLTLLQSKIATKEVTCDFTDATNDGAETMQHLLQYIG